MTRWSFSPLTASVVKTHQLQRILFFFEIKINKLNENKFKCVDVLYRNSAFVFTSIIQLSQK